MADRDPQSSTPGDNKGKALYIDPFDESEEFTEENLQNLMSDNIPTLLDDMSFIGAGGVRIAAEQQPRPVNVEQTQLLQEPGPSIPNNNIDDEFDIMSFVDDDDTIPWDELFGALDDNLNIDVIEGGDNSNANDNLDAPSTPLNVEGTSSEPSSSTSNQRTRRRSPLSLQRERTQNMKMHEISSFLHLPLVDAAAHLKMSQTALKRICRREGLGRWPHRRIECRRARINELKHRQPNTHRQSEIEKLQHEIELIYSGALKEE